LPAKLEHHGIATHGNYNLVWPVLLKLYRVEFRGDYGRLLVDKRSCPDRTSSNCYRVSGES